MRLSDPWSQPSARIAAAIFLLALLVIAGRNTLDILSFNNYHEELRILYHFDPAQADSNGTLITWRFTATGCDDRWFHFQTVS